jgi:hypothetical protein
MARSEIEVDGMSNLQGVSLLFWYNTISFTISSPHGAIFTGSM